MFDQILSQFISLSHSLKIDMNTEKTKQVFIQNKETVKDEQAMFELLMQAWKEDIEQQYKDTASQTVETLKDMNKRLNNIRQETEISTPVVYKDKTELEEALKVSVERMTSNKMDGFDVLCQEIADINTPLYQSIQEIDHLFNSHGPWQIDFKMKMYKCFDIQYDPYYVNMLRRHMHINTEECLDSYLLACHALARYYAIPFD
ncbi:uncharacterized protein B0P05DRAFT_560745 [Gilbertella persicaria]|uniref:uncharacterized protein n=1 Tax=Gilbertella persicaria TaxID=101096 RepID=UPI00221FDC1F|nr:uncharacterized protein B0P05DRAFT_566167 [Gilbertella persicaria]XP_051429466.1 uncharacterized protein B0P05DRAFT_564919 [Gilbertella persicaria]XP_051430344.1 uncharacterized protein B0P05DRAFT_560745 [Gilbertella persicaria]KAI8047410.1 hypothetical protein B0P05DRAFT_566167 [Gilbertella persicaria]KAI8048064.1 hypothetical protein B0P05DRAFT_564919 [Gilbertella persicaria]KAI8054922.1 hypothetical protein B0P05DRAFT_560745 [Gilbertella persicaria]